MIDPTWIVGEVLGESADLMRNPVNADYRCPYLNAQCVKRSQRTEGPFPVCSVFRGGGRAEPGTEELIAVCPKRFLDIDFASDVKTHCWIGEAPANLHYAQEVKMAGFGQVDLVIAELNRDASKVLKFVSVELQAVDISGSYEPAYTALLNSQFLRRKPVFGFNWANVRKRYVSQLVVKGFFHHLWNTRVVSVLQDHVFHRIQAFIRFDHVPVETANIVFMVYKFADAPERGLGQRKWVLDRVVGTSHSSLMTASLYRQVPAKEDFCKRILERVKA